MVEFHLFASRNFVGANLVALVVTFAMLAQFFFIALYMQNILGLSPLEAGVRFLPGDPDDRHRSPRWPAGSRTASGPRWPIAVGLTLVSASLYPADPDRPAHHLLPPAALVPPDGDRHGAGDVADVDRGDERRGPGEGGIASGILSMSRMVGGTLGVAVIGAVFQGAARSQLDDSLAGLAGDRRPARASSPTTSPVAPRPRPPGSTPLRPRQVAPAGHDAFIGAFASSMRVDDRASPPSASSSPSP